MPRFAAIRAKLIRGDEGATMVEYALMLAFIAIVCLAGVSALGKSGNSRYSSVASTL
jgi:pilus assembly protein Flp/PilA